jgi:hypothetical protein
VVGDVQVAELVHDQVVEHRDGRQPAPSVKESVPRAEHEPHSIRWPPIRIRWDRFDFAGDRVDDRRGRGRRSSGNGLLMRLTSETKHSTKTTEFYAMLAIIAGILIPSWIVGQGDGNGKANVDAFPAVRAWLYVAIVGVAYMISRGLTKAGSRHPYWSTGDDLPAARDDDQAVSRDR